MNFNQENLPRLPGYSFSDPRVSGGAGLGKEGEHGAEPLRDIFLLIFSFFNVPPLLEDGSEQGGGCREGGHLMSVSQPRGDTRASTGPRFVGRWGLMLERVKTSFVVETTLEARQPTTLFPPPPLLLSAIREKTCPRSLRSLRTYSHSLSFAPSLSRLTPLAPPRARHETIGSCRTTGAAEADPPDAGLHAWRGAHRRPG